MMAGKWDVLMKKKSRPEELASARCTGGEVCVDKDFKSSGTPGRGSDFLNNSRCAETLAPNSDRERGI